MIGSRRIRANRALRAEADAALGRFLNLVRDELRRYDPAGRASAELRRYLGPQLAAGGELSPLGVAGYSARLRPVIETILAGPPGLRILDAGSGYGTESLLFAWLGADVTAVELVRERHDIARGRPETFRRPGDPPLRIDFVHANILRFLQSSPAFDLIWTMEAISHIYPPERFLDLARGRLAPGGLLAVSDPNQANPVAWARAVLLRGSIRHVPHRKFTDPESGISVEYGQEQIHSVRGMTRLLLRSGYTVERCVVSGFLASTLLPRKWRNRRVPVALSLAFQKSAGRTPLIRRLGANYTILARSSA